MIKDFDTVRAQLKELSDVLNSYKSEAVQLRLVDLIFGASAIPAVKKHEDAEVGGVMPPPKKRKKARTARGSSGAKEAPDRTARSSARPGARATLATLHAEGFFKKPRTIGGLVTHCDANLASKFKQSDFSGALARYVREKKLTRVKNGDSQYEYTQA